jgi:mRNA interferase MazF
VLVVQSDHFNRSRIQTVLAVVITSNTQLAAAPGNVLLTRRQSGLNKDSVVNVSQVVTLDRSFLTERVRMVRRETLVCVEAGLRLVLDL